jgi:hypothetical protein
MLAMALPVLSLHEFQSEHDAEPVERLERQAALARHESAHRGRADSDLLADRLVAHAAGVDRRAELLGERPFFSRTAKLA